MNNIKLPKVTDVNYYDKSMAQIYMGASQFKDFRKCEAGALAKLNGMMPDERTTALLIGSYVDAHFAGTLDIFRAQNPEIYKKDGNLKSDYEHANYIIQRIERDPLMMEYLSGKSQTIMTGEIEGVPVKIRMDSYMPGERIVDLKIMRSFDDVWVEGEGKTSFVTAWGYDIQAAIYQEIERQNSGGDRLPFYIAGATKEKPEPDIAVFEIPQDVIDGAMMLVRNEIFHFDNLKQGVSEPERCEQCDYCRATKILTGPVDFRLASGVMELF